jgi:aspartate kinase
VIVAGFQGVSERLEITSLGRGGSDTTAVALAAALGAEFAEICSDVDGIYSADPRVASKAQRVAQLSYDEMQSLADSGAKVLNAEAVEWARRNQIEVICSATQGPVGSGTSVSPLAPTTAHEHPRASAVTHHPGLCYLYGHGAPSPELLETLERFGLTEADVQRTGPLSRASHDEGSWACWAPIQNLHPVEPFFDAVQRCGATVEPEAWTLVSVIGRGLLSGGERGPRSLAQEAIRALGIYARGPEVSPSRLRWAVAEQDAKRLVLALHKRLIEGDDT